MKNLGLYKIEKQLFDLSFDFKYGLIIFFLINVFPAFGQKKLSFDIPVLPLEIKVKIEDNDPNLVKVEFFKDKEPYDTIRLTKTGKFDNELEMGFQYQVIFSKAGFISKTYTINTDIGEEIIKKNSTFPELKFEIYLFKVYDDIDATQFDLQPAGEIKYDDEKDDFIFIDYHLDDDIIKEIEKKKNQGKEQDKMFDLAIEAANEAFNANKYEEAKKQYSHALELKPEAKYPPKKIKEIDKILEGQSKRESEIQALNNAYNEIVKQADKSFKEKNYEQAVELYTKVIEIKKNDQYASSKIQESKRLLSDNIDQKRRAIIEAYRDTVNIADLAYKDKDYDKAKDFYRKALIIKLDEKYPDEMIKKIEYIIQNEFSFIKNLQQKQNWYNSTVILADSLFKEYQYIEAINVLKKVIRFQRVEKFNQDDMYPGNQIFKMESVMLKTSKAQLDSLMKDQQFKRAIKDAENAFDNLQYTLAKSAYQIALTYKPNSEFVMEKIAEINKLLLEKAEFEKSIKDKETSYKKAIAIAEEALKNYKTNEALQAFKNALVINPDAKYAQAQVKLIENQINEKTLKEKDLKEKNEAYKNKINEADQLLKDKSYNDAKLAYIEALKIDPSQPYPSDKIKEVENLISIQTLTESEKLAKEESYKILISKGDETFDSKKYFESKSGFEQALKIKPGESYPKQRVLEIERILSELSKAELEKLTREQSYSDAIIKGDKALKERRTQDAINSFNEAIKIKPNDPVALSKIEDTQKIINDIKLAEAKRIEIENSFKALIEKGDKAFGEKLYIDARNAYTEALTIQPKAKYPNEKIAQIENLLDAISKKETERKAKQESFEKAIALAQAAYISKIYKLSKTNYESALKIFPNQDSLLVKIQELKILISEEERLEAEKKSKELAYRAAVGNGDLAFSNKQYSKAIEEYGKASGLLPEEKYPVSRISDIDKLLKQNEAEYVELINTADKAFNDNDFTIAEFYYKKAYALRAEKYPHDKITESKKKIEEINNSKNENEYRENINAADTALIKKQYSVAEFYYKKAMVSKKNDEYVLQKLDEISKARETAIQEAKNNEYNEHIKSGEDALSKKEYGVAKFYFEKAIVIKPNEEFPKLKLKEIDKAIKGINN